MESKDIKVDNSKYIKLDTIKKCEFTGKQYDAIRLVKCNCMCHTNKSIMHFQACCDNGYVEERVYIN